MTLLWVKAFHVVFVMSWFAGLFYLPRLFINIALDPNVETRARLVAMARKLFRFTTMLAIPAVLLGAWLFLGFGVGLHGPGNGWMHAKLFLVLCVLGYHHACGVMLRGLEAGAPPRPDRFYRIFNESAVVLLAAIVVLVIVKPF